MSVFTSERADTHTCTHTHRCVCLPSGAGGPRELGQAGSRGLWGRSQWEREGHCARDVQRKCNICPTPWQSFSFSNTLLLNLLSCHNKYQKTEACVVVKRVWSLLTASVNKRILFPWCSCLFCLRVNFFFVRFRWVQIRSLLELLSLMRKPHLDSFALEWHLQQCPGHSVPSSFLSSSLSFPLSLLPPGPISKLEALSRGS